MEINLCAIHDIFLNFNKKPCTHYNELFKPFYLTCKTLSKLLTIVRIHRCNICYFREISCFNCKTNNTQSCNECKCKVCKLSANLTGNFPSFLGSCCNCLPSWCNNHGDYNPITYRTIKVPTIPIAQKPKNYNIMEKTGIA